MSRTKCDIKLDTLTTLSPTQLHDQWKELSGEDLPNLPARRIQHLIAYRLQEKQYGKLPLQIERQLDRLAASWAKGSQTEIFLGRPVRDRIGPIVHGTRFVREWNGKTITVTKTEQGFEWNGSTYRSLSEIARKATGAHWSGPRFFGLKRRQG
jgi:Protein of unknown function (DUF2924)